MHHTFAVLVLSAITLVIVSRFTKRKSDDELRGVVWTRDALRSSVDGEKKRPAWQSLKLWWALMFAVIVGLCTATAFFGSGSKVHEAERMPFQVDGGNTEIRPRGTLKDFNLWTGTGELLFRPEKAGESITFSVPVDKSGAYKLALVVTRGEGYGPFRAEINGQPATLVWQQSSGENEGYRVIRRESETFPPAGEETVEAGHVVERVGLGQVDSGDGPIRIKLIAESELPIGVDSLVVTQADR